MVAAVLLGKVPGNRFCYCEQMKFLICRMTIRQYLLHIDINILYLQC